MTTASWIRKFIHSHSDYKQDSVVSEGIAYDLLKQMQGITDGEIPCPELLGNLVSKAPQDYKVIDCHLEPPTTASEK